MDRLASFAVHVLSVCLLTACGPTTLSDNVEANSHGEVSISSSMFSDPAERKLAREIALAKELTKTIEDLRGVASARVHLSLAAHSVLERGAPSESRAAVLVQSEKGQKVNEQTVRDLISAAIPGLSPGNVRVFFGRPVSQPRQAVYVGPIEVAPSSVRIARLCLGGLLLLSFGLAVGLIGAGVKLRRLKNR